MDGAPITVMSNSGSGNQGISSMLPVLTFAEEQGASREATTRAIMLSSLLVVYIKQLLGRLSCLCGMVVSGDLAPPVLSPTSWVARRSSLSEL